MAVRMRPRAQARKGSCFQRACVPGPGSGRAAGKPAHRGHAAAVPFTSSACPRALAPAGCRQRLWNGTGRPRREAVAVPACTTPPLYNPGEPAKTCALPHGAAVGPSSAGLRPHQGFQPPRQTYGVVSLSREHCHPPSPLQPHRDGALPEPEPQLPWRAGAACRGGWGWVPG